ncbi:peptidyl-prolyl cis-trans isomerase C [Litorimonas taeanensis]|uniref:Parvulin-like PPIase n=1 Tax=Litorimonas taeanensis TaxID=568099 RepID=A0A420WF13_9PROT|nr:peptidylprolyl isomerase [Litorimonas taeanensis]RKQ69571.1 peptidyl-prolyl cis-trans isomerase C [Litorimonas taeanensis]
MRQFSPALALMAFLLLGACGKPEDKITQTETVTTQQKKEAQASKRLGAVEVARIGASSIFHRDVQRLAKERGLITDGQEFPRSDPQYQVLLDSLIDQRLLAQAAVKRALDQTDENKFRLAAARERILSNALLEEHLKAKVNETTIRRLYEEQSALADRGDEVRVRHILLSDEASAKAAFKALADGEAFSDLARSVSLDLASRENGGDLGYMTRDMPPPDFADIIFSAKEGTQTEIFQTELGWHIAEIIDRRSSRKQSFEAVRPNIVKFLTFEAVETLLTDLRRETEIEIYRKPIIAPDNTINKADDIDSDTSLPKDN